jgi:hypothetical protein
MIFELKLSIGEHYSSPLFFVTNTLALMNPSLERRLNMTREAFIKGLEKYKEDLLWCGGILSGVGITTFAFASNLSKTINAYGDVIQLKNDSAYLDSLFNDAEREGKTKVRLYNRAKGKHYDITIKAKEVVD